MHALESTLIEHVLHRTLIRRERIAAEADDPHLVDIRVASDGVPELPNGNARRPGHWKPVRSGADRWKRDRTDVVLRGKRHAASVAVSQRLVLSVATSAPDRTDGVDHRFRG